MALDITPVAPVTAATPSEPVRAERPAEPAVVREDGRTVAEELARDAEVELAAADRKRLQTHRQAAGDNAIRKTKLDIAVDNDGVLVVKVRDAQTDKVVRTIPPEELVEFGRKMRRYLGLILDRRA